MIVKDGSVVISLQKETVFIKKSVLEDAIKLGKAEVISEPGD